MGGGGKNFVRLPVFHDAALAHHGNTVRNVMNHGQIMGNEDHGQVQVAGQSDEKVQNLGLDGDVQRRNGFIRNDQPGFRSQGTRDGYALARAAGHTIVPCRPALVPIETKESWCAELMGLSLKNVRLSACVAGGKRFYSEMGEMLFTHFGISGPLVLTLSSLLPEEGEVRLSLDLKPALDEGTLDKRLLRDFAAAKNCQISTVMDGLEPHSLGQMLLRLADISPYMPVHSVTAAQRKQLVKLMKAVPLTVKGTRGMEEAVITRGGVQVKEVNPSTLESRLLPGLYFAGEVLDVDALTGGFNLQIAFSTGALAGASAAKEG